MLPYMRRVLTGIAICDGCGAAWELYRIPADQALCRTCGTKLILEDDRPGAPAGDDDDSKATGGEEIL